MWDTGTVIRRRQLWTSRVAVRGYAVARAAADRVGLQLMLKTYYSPIPDLRGLPAGTWSDGPAMAGVTLDLDAQLRFLAGEVEGQMKSFMAETAQSPGPLQDDPRESYLYEPGNPSYPMPDARLLFALVRGLRPRSIVELGSGQTSRVIGQAVRMNAAEGHETRYRAFDPHPTTVDGDLPGLDELALVDAQRVPAEVFEELQSGDVLFVDTTHTVKLGSDVNRIVLDVLPLLAPGVLVHFHDIFLPYEYPRYLFADYGLCWAEQYLLQAFLSMNPDFEVLCSVYALCRDRAGECAANGLARGGEHGGAFWIRRR